MSPGSIGVNLRVTGHCSQGGRKYMEDFFSVAYQQSEDEKDLEYAYFGIYDGHGGSEAATYAKEHLMNSIVNQKLFWSDCDQDILRAIREGYIATHYAMWREQEKWPKTATGLPSTAGTTASVAFIRRGKIYIGHVGDSGIVLGYQEEGEKFWRAKPLTHDHKPECNVEKARIINSGGKVVTKSGVPRVVWNRPRIGHKGPVRRSTPIDEIPFLAVARSLGDLWSYNSALNEFVVSPDPDVRVIKIDPKTYRCLIFGTDGLWNVLSPSDAVELARDTEIINEKILYMEGGRSTEWTNPSKCLVDKALERWCSKKMRADNTSVVTIMLDPPGPPKKDIITRNYSTASYGLEYIQLDGLNDDTLIGNIEYNSDNSNSNILMDNYPILDNSTVAMYDDHSILGNGHTSSSLSSSSSALSDSYNTFPTNGYAIMTSYENNCNDDNSRLSIINDEEEEDANTHEYHSYHSLDESGIIGQDHIVQHHQSHTMNQQQQHQYQQQCMSAEEGYSLTKLETRCEQQFRQQQQHLSPSAFHEYNNQYDNITSSYNQQTMTSPTVSLNCTINNQHSRHNEYYNNNRENSNLITITPNNSVIQQNNNGNSSSSNNNSNSQHNNKYENDNNDDDDKMTTSINDKKSNEQNLDLLKTTELKVDNKNYEYTNIDNSTMEVDEDEEINKNINNQINLDESIQINEISSSVIEPVTIEVCIENNKKLMTSNDEPSSSSSSIIEINDIQKTPRTRRSIKQLYKQNHKSNKNIQINNNRTKSTNKILIEQNENISLIFEPRKLRSTVINCNNKRNLRSRDTTTTTTSSSNLSKDMKIKPLITHKKQQQQQHTKRNLNNYLKVSNSSTLVTITPSSTIRTRQFQQQITSLKEIQQQQQQRSQEISTVWSPRQKRLKNNSPILRRTAADSSFKSLTNKNKPKIISSYLGSSSSSSLSSSVSSSSSTSSLIVSSSSSSSTLSSKRSSNLRNQSSSAWCSNNNNNNKSAVQTRNRVQKRLSH